MLPDKNVAYISLNSEEIAKEEYEILRAGEFAWEFAVNGEIPLGAVGAGWTLEGERLFYGRAIHDGTQTPGKVI